MASDSTLSLTWEPPFTLDITGEDPDITYCVDVVDLLSQCGITESEFTYPLLDAICQGYSILNFTITPVNVVSEGAPSSVSYIGTEAGKLMVVNSIEQVQKVYADGGSGG